MLVCSLDTDLNYVTTMLQLRPPLNQYVKLWQLLGGGGDAETFWVYPYS